MISTLLAVSNEQKPLPPTMTVGHAHIVLTHEVLAWATLHSLLLHVTNSVFHAAGHHAGAQVVGEQ